MTRPNAATPPARRILLVDHHPGGRTARKTVLEQQGYEVLALASPQEALERFGQGEFHLVITGFKMPRMNGIELIERLKAERREIPAILISGFAEPLGLDETNTGADAVVAKNAHEIPTLLHAVDRLLRKKTPRKPVASQRSARARRTSLMA